MKKLIIGLLLFSVQNAFSNSCPKDLIIYGEASSFERIDNKVEKVTEKYILPKKLSDHMGSFDNLIFESKVQLKSIQVLEQTYELKKDKEDYKSVNFSLQKVIENNHLEGEFNINILGVDGFKCSKKFEVIISE